MYVSSARCKSYENDVQASLSLPILYHGAQFTMFFLYVVSIIMTFHLIPTFYILSRRPISM